MLLLASREAVCVALEDLRRSVGNHTDSLRELLENPAEFIDPKAMCLAAW